MNLGNEIANCMRDLANRVNEKVNFAHNSTNCGNELELLCARFTFFLDVMCGAPYYSYVNWCNELNAPTIVKSL